MHRTILFSLMVFLLVPLGLTLCQVRPDPIVFLQACLDKPSNGLPEPAPEAATPAKRTADPLAQPVRERPAAPAEPLVDPIQAGPLLLADVAATVAVAADPLNNGPLIKPVRPVCEVLEATLPSRSSALVLSAAISGAIGYFAGQTNCLGQTLPVDPNRYLAGERLLLVLDFNQDPGLIEVEMNGQTWRFYGISGRLHYETGLIIPDWPETLSWSGERLNPPLVLVIRAAARTDTAQTVTAVFSDIELTGHVRELVRAQPVCP